MARNTARFLISWIIGVLILILLVFLINMISIFLPNPFTTDLAHFMNSNIILLIVISFLFFLGSLFYYFGFPANLVFPIFDAFGGALIVYFIINFIVLIDKYLLTGIGNVISPYSMIISVVVFVIIIIFGYISVLQSINKRRRHVEMTDRPVHMRRRVIRRTTY